jgi:hypothetical protein
MSGAFSMVSDSSDISASGDMQRIFWAIKGIGGISLRGEFSAGPRLLVPVPPFNLSFRELPRY